MQSSTYLVAQRMYVVPPCAFVTNLVVKAVDERFVKSRNSRRCHINHEIQTPQNGRSEWEYVYEQLVFVPVGAMPIQSGGNDDELEPERSTRTGSIRSAIRERTKIYHA